MNLSHIHYSGKAAFIATLVFALLGMFSYLLLEPVVSHSQTSNPHDFIVTQSITDEISFLVEAADVTMIGSIQGLSGGYASGTTFAVVQTNDPQGYSMTLAFSDDPAMNANATSSSINNYSPAAAGVPDYAWVDNTTGQPAEFGYTVRASTTSDLDQSFLDNGSVCNTGSSDTGGIASCWLNPSTTTETIINRSTPAADGATTSISFKVAVPSNPSPALPADTYTATGTLTATNNP